MGKAEKFERRATWACVGAALPVVWLIAQALAAREDPGTAQMYLAIAVTYLTLVLIGITGFYAWVTWQSLLLLKTEHDEKKSISLAARIEWMHDESVKIGVMNLSATGVYVSAIELNASVKEAGTNDVEAQGAKFVLPPYSEREIVSGNIMRELLGPFDLSSPKEVVVYANIHHYAHGQSGSHVMMGGFNERVMRGPDGRFSRF